MEYKFKGTQGDWSAKGLHVFCDNKRIGQSFVMTFNYDHRGKSIEDVEGEANAYLFAAAPDLLQACITLHQILEPLTKNPASDKVMQQLKQGIHKALNINP